MDKFLTKDKVAVIIQNAPTGTKPEDVVNGLVSRGYKLEGFNDQPEPEQQTQNQPQEKNGRLVVGSTTPDLSLVKGVAKGVASTVKGIADLGDKFLNTVGAQESQPVYQEGTPEYNAVNQALTPVNSREKLGKTAEQIAEFAIPGTKVSKATQGANFVQKVVPRALTSGTIAAAQQGEVGKDALVAAGTEVVLPGLSEAVKPATRLISRVFKGLASGLSGVSTDAIDAIVSNPSASQETVKQLTKSGNREVLEQNSKTIVKGIGKVRQEARQAYGEALDTLKETDIKPKAFRDSVQAVLDKYGVSTSTKTKTGLAGNKLAKTERLLENIEFEDPKNISKAKKLIQEVQNAELNGKSLKALMDKISKERFSIATSDERLAFNAFIGDLENGLKTAINNSTDALKDMNLKYTTDLQLTEAMERIFGKVKFQNAKEIDKASQGLEALFNKKGLSPEYIDDFLTRIGVAPSDFRASEATRQISEKVMSPTNTAGVNVGELIRSLTGGIVSPKMIRDAAILTGKSETTMKELLENTAPALRGTLIKVLTGQD